MTSPLCLGADPQPRRLGLALVTFEGVPLWAHTYNLRGPGMDEDQAVRDAVKHAATRFEREGWQVERLGIERGVVKGPRVSQDVIYSCGGAYALAKAAIRRRFRDTLRQVVPLRPREWNVRAFGQGHGNDRKDATAVIVRGLALAAGWDEVQMNGLAEHDACDAVGIALAAVKKGGPA